jgi:hypothetical protein
MAVDIASVAAAARAAGRITDDDVAAMRRAIWGSQSGVSREAALLLMALNREVRERGQAWPALYNDALMDFFLYDQAEPVIDDRAGELLVKEITADSSVDDATELRLLLSLTARASSCPPPVVALARDSLLASVQASEQPLFSERPRRARAIDEDDLEAIRRLVYGQGGAGGLHVNEGEALWLAALDRATADAANAPGWREIYVKAMAMYLLLGRGTAERLDAGGVAWIRQHLHGGRGLTPNGKALVAYVQREATACDPSLQALAA